MDPLGDVDKFLDCQLRPKAVLSAIGGGGGKDASAPDPISKALVKQYLIKWKSRSYLHCSWYVSYLRHLFFLIGAAEFLVGDLHMNSHRDAIAGWRSTHPNHEFHMEMHFLIGDPET